MSDNPSVPKPSVPIPSVPIPKTSYDPKSGYTSAEPRDLGPRISDKSFKPPTEEETEEAARLEKTGFSLSDVYHTKESVEGADMSSAVSGKMSSAASGKMSSAASGKMSSGASGGKGKRRATRKRSRNQRRTKKPGKKPRMRRSRKHAPIQKKGTRSG